MDNDTKSRLWGALACFVLFALAWLVFTSKYGLEYVHIHGVAAGVSVQFKLQMKWLITTVIKFGFSAGIFWFLAYLVPAIIKKLRH